MPIMGIKNCFLFSKDKKSDKSNENIGKKNT